MRQRAQLGVSLLAILTAGMTFSCVVTALAVPDADQDRRQSEAPLTARQIRALVDRAIENQHRNDLSLDQYARTEHEFIRGNGKEPDRNIVARVVPAGGNVLKVEVERNGKMCDSATLERQWHTVAQALIASSEGEEIRGSGLVESSRRRNERAEMVAAIGKAFIFRWAGRFNANGHSVVKLNFEPDPTYRSSARFAALYAHSRGTAWVDETSGQLVKAEAELTDDVSWGGGLIAKLYKGGKFTYEQREVSPGVWMPAYYAYDFDGRKLFFALSAHEKVEYTDYLRLGPPQEALAVIRREHPGVFSKAN